MTDKIAEITEKIYNEGIVKAKEDALQILENAKKEGEEIILKAKQQELKIIALAKADSEDMMKKTISELKLSARQFISELKKQITSLILAAQTEPIINQSFQDMDFIQNILLTIIQNWNPEKSEELDLKILLPKKHEKELSVFFKTKAFEQLNKGIEIIYDSETKSGFKISPKNGSYIISFSERDFENYFKGYLKEKTRHLLFDE